MFAGMPVAFAFLLVNLVAAFFLMKGEVGVVLAVNNIRDGITKFSLLPAPLFILMGEAIFQSGITSPMIDTVDKWMGRLPGRLALVTIAVLPS